MRISDWSSDVCSSDLVGLSADECAIIAGSVTIIGMHDIEEDHVPGLDHAIGESVRVWTASRTGDRVDALHPLRAHSKSTIVGDGDQFIRARAWPEDRKSVVVGMSVGDRVVLGGGRRIQ